MAYIVGSASVSIVPDFRQAQIEITKFFAGQKDRLVVPVKADVDEAASRAAGVRMGKAVEDGAKQARAAADKDAIQAAKVRDQAINRAYGDALRIQAQMDRQAAQERERQNRESIKAVQQIAAARAKAENDAAREAAQLRQQAFREEERAFRDQLRSQIAMLKQAQREASREEKIRLQFEIDQREAVLAGRTYGGFFTRALQREMKENGLVVAAALGAGLLVGAPVAAAAATTLFAGIGAAAAFQNDRLRSSWVGLWDEIKSNAVSDAAVLVPAYERMAGSIGQSFQRIRPELQKTFEALGPQVDSFSASLTQTAENALPGLTRAVREGMPVTKGFGDLMERTGSGISSFFDRITQHAPASGAALRSLGDTMRAVLPLLGETLGQGAETAAIVLPVLNSALRGTLTVVDALGGALPSLLSSFLAFRLVQGTARVMTGWSQSLGLASISGGRFAEVQGRAAETLRGVARSLPLVGAAVALFAGQMAAASQDTQRWTQALITGGKAASTAMDEYRESQNRLVGTPIGDFFQSVDEWIGLKGSMDDAKKAADDYLNSLTPLERAQHGLDVATRNLADAQSSGTASASELASLQADVANATARAAAEAEKLERATRGVTEAMAEQADAARARVDADFGYQKALLDVEKSLQDVTKAQADLDKARAEGTAADVAAAELNLREALLGVNEAYSDQVRLAGEIAMSNLPASMNDTQKAILGAKAELDELNRLIANGVQLSPSMETYRQSLEQITGEADGAALAQAQLIAALGEVGAAVTAIPGTKAVQIDAPTDELKQRLLDLGFTVTTMPDGEIRVQADTDEAKANLGVLSSDLATLDGTTAKPGVTLVDKGFIGPVQTDQAQLNALGGTEARPGVALVDKGFIGPVQNNTNLLGILGRMTPTPVVSVRDQASGPLGGIAGQLAALRDKTITITTIQRTAVQAANALIPGATGGAVEHLRPQMKFDGGGAVVGRGSARDDLVPAQGPMSGVDYRIANGEHILDGLDVLLMGGQAGVYAFREALNSGRFGSPGPDTAIRAMVSSSPVHQAAAAAPSSSKAFHFYTPDVAEAARQVRALEHQDAVLSTPWRGR